MNGAFQDWRQPLWSLGLLLAALWPHWTWIGRRARDGSDEPWGLLAWLTIIAMVWLDRRHLAVKLPGAALAGAGGLALAATASLTLLPPIVAAAAAMLALAALLAGLLPASRPRLPLVVLALLALPLTASLNFYLGYPLRLLCGHGAALILSAAGWQVTPDGAALLWNGQTILVDAPCAGIAMLWVGAYSAALMSYLYRASALRTLLNLSLGGLIVVAGNVVRNAALFFKEARILDWPAWTHDAIGLALFCAMFWLMYQLFSRRPHAPH